MNAATQLLGALIEAWGEVKVQKARVVLSLVGVVAAVAAMTVVIALGDLILQSSRELAELYEGRSVTLRLAPEQSSASQGGPSNGGPSQEAGTGEGAQASSMVTIRVADDGPGIPPAIRDRVFDRFVRGDSSRTRDGRGSSGLGMSIVDSLARAMGGAVRLVDSEKGTVIDVTLPAA